MKKLVKADGLQNRVTEQEANAFDPNLGPCCDITNFKVHLEGTTCNAWNKSAIDIFVKGFLEIHTEYPSQVESVRDMVKMKSRATLDSTIRKYRDSKIPRTLEESKEIRLQKNRQERKRKVCFFVPHSIYEM